MREAMRLKPIITAKKPCLMPEFTDNFGAAFAMSLNKGWGTWDTMSMGVISRPYVEFSPRIESAYLTQSFARDFYSRIRVEPIFFNVGNVTGDVFLTFTIFNAFFKPVILTHVEMVNREGIHTDIVTPKTIAPLEQIKYIIKVTTDGPPSINTTLKLFFDESSENKSIRIDGARSVVIPFMSLVGQSERLEWLTTIGKSRDGTEERTSVRHVPRWSMNCTFDLPERGDRRLAGNIGVGWVKRAYTVPFWHKSTRSVGPLSVGDVNIMCDTSHCEFKPGNNAMLWSSSHDHESVEILEVMPDRIVASKPVKYARDHFMVVPAYSAVATNGVTVSGTSVGGELSATFELSHLSQRYTPDKYTTYDGYVVMPFKAFGEEPRDNIKTRVDTFDNKVGAVSFDMPELRPTLDRPFSLFADGKAEYIALKRWLSYCAGQYSAFLYDTNMYDMDLIHTGHISTSFDIRSDRFTGMSEEYRNRLVIEKSDGAILYVKVLSSTDHGDGIETIMIDTNLACDPQDIKRISFLMCGRFASDSFTIRSLGRDRFSVNVTFKEV